VIHAFLLMLLRGTPLHGRRHELALVEEQSIFTECAINRVQLGIPHVVKLSAFFLAWS
jgi:hypothetical protein